MEEDYPGILDNTKSLVKIIWDAGAPLFVDETKDMYANIHKDLCFPGTRFPSCAIQFNMATKTHMDDGNYINGWQGVLVLGLPGGFKGGSVDFGAGDTIVRVHTRHGTIFFGKNRQVLHKVHSVYSGSRLIVACWCGQEVAEFSKKVLMPRVYKLEWCETLRVTRCKVLADIRTRLGGCKKDKARIKAKTNKTKKWFKTDKKNF
jgi:hypothetical protein